MKPRCKAGEFALLTVGNHAGAMFECIEWAALREIDGTLAANTWLVRCLSPVRFKRADDSVLDLGYISDTHLQPLRGISVRELEQECATDPLVNYAHRRAAIG